MCIPIRDSEDFLLAWNCAVRIAEKEEDVLLVSSLYETYQAFFDARTLSCGIRDLEGLLGYQSSGFPAEELPLDLRQQAEDLLLALWARSCSLFGRDDPARLREAEADLLRRASGDREKPSVLLQEMRAIFSRSVSGEQEPSKILSGSLFLREEDAPLLNQLAIQMVRYAWGRHTYMPSACSHFVQEIRLQLSGDTLDQILQFIEENNDRIRPADENPSWGLPGDYLEDLAGVIRREQRERHDNKHQ